MIEIECKGTPHDLGNQYGEAARKDIQFACELWEECFKKNPVSDAFMDSAVTALEKFAPCILTELRAVAEGANVSFQTILAVNFVDTFDSKIERCTPLLLHDSPEGPVIAKNNDAGPTEKYPFVVRKCNPDHGLPFYQVTYAGWLSGLDMMNAEGLVNTHGSVGSKFTRCGLRLDIRLRLYQLMQNCRTIDSLYDGLQEASVPLTGKGFSIALADANGNTMFIDAPVPHVIARSRNIPFAWSANLYQAKGYENADERPPEVRPFCQKRTAYIASQPVPQNRNDIEKLLKDHSAVEAPCRHGGASRSVTTWSMIALPKERTLYVAHGFPCKKSYKKYFL